MTEKYKYLIALCHFSKFGPVRLSRIYSHFKDYKKAFFADSDNLIKAGIEPKVSQEFISYRGQIEIDDVIKKINKENIKVVTIHDNIYPSKLKEIFSPPQILFYKGNIENIENSLAVVGSRLVSDYGKEVVFRLVRDLARKRIPIVSGLAFGVDSFSHEIALEEGTKTIAVLGSGIDNSSIYPSHNRYLADRIVKAGGAVMSEFIPGTAPLKHHFPQRNRIVAGLALGTLVIEAREKSGALITAKYALEQGREVFCIPGNIFSNNSKGTNNLIKQGASLVTQISDIMDQFDFLDLNNYISNESVKFETESERLVFEKMQDGPIHINDICRLTKMSIIDINSTLTILELRGYIKNLGNMNYIKTI